MNDDFERGMIEWWDRNAVHRDQSVHSDPEVYGLNLDAVRPRFATYVERARRWTSHG